MLLLYSVSMVTQVIVNQNQRRKLKYSMRSLTDFCCKFINRKLKKRKLILNNGKLKKKHPKLIEIALKTLEF